MAPEGPSGRLLSSSGRSSVQRRRSSALRVLVGNEQGRPVSAPGLARWLERVAPARARGTVSLAIVSDKRVRALNCQYRGRDYATDVLSFPIGAPALAAPFLGDIVIARGVARRQARRARHSERVELRVLALHGLLHLLGYDHECDQGQMQREERRLRRKGGLREGLIERVQPAARAARAARPRSTTAAEPVKGRATSR
ncbi:MAG: rRNA maturation RNase YbeY [Acidobacteriota bacterium]